MSKINFSTEQLNAIETKNSSILVSAAAGSGKTAVLVERIIRHICDDKIDIDKLLVVTFTNAAAQGMKEKIKRELNLRIKENPKDMHLRKQLALLNISNISTVHSFCGNLIKKYNHCINEDIPSNYTMLEETERELIINKVINEVLDSYYEKEDEVFYKCIESFGGGRTDDLFIKLIIDIYEYIVSIPFYRSWLLNVADMQKNNCGFFKSIYADYLWEYLKKVLTSAIDKYEFALSYISSDEGLLPYMDTFLIERNYFNKALYADSLKECLNTLNKITFETIARAKKGADTFVPKTIRNSVKDIIKEINTYFNEANLINTDTRSDLIEKIIEIIIEFDDKFKEYKYGNNNLDFNDLEHLTIELLCDGNLSNKSEVAKELTQYFYEILVDEYQDTNDVQEAIFTLISKENNLFSVGDLKQSIYRFRHANPNLFIKRLNLYRKNENQKKLIFLNANYRSEEKIIKTVNYIFSYLMNHSTLKINYEETDKLIMGKSFPDDAEKKKNCELLIALTDKEDENTIEAAEASLIAKRIKEIINDKDFFVFENGVKRNAKFKDITILLRNFNDKSLLFLKELSSNGIPVIYDDKTNFFETTEIKIILSLLKVLNNPYDDISLISVLRNIFEFTDDELINIRANASDGTFYDAVKNEKDKRITDILNYLEELRSFSFKYEIHTLLNKIYADTFFIEKQLYKVDGAKRKENLLKLVEIAKSFESTGFKGISAFISYINKIILSERKIPSLSGVFEDSNCVRVMSIHKSKGLEFPIVIIAGLHKQINKRDLSSAIILNSHLGIGADYTDLELRCKYPTVYKKIIASEELSEMIAEEIRILYVAMTRAENKLILTGALKNGENGFEKYAKMILNKSFSLSYIDFLNIKTGFDMVLPPLLYHKDLSGLRSIYLDNTFIKASDFDIDFKTFTSEDFKTEIQIQLENIENIKEKLKEELTESETIAFNDALDFKYESRLLNIPQKISVSELKGIYSNDENYNAGRTLTIKPDFSEDSNLTAAQRGTLIHYIFEHIDLNMLKATDDFFSVIEKLYSDNKYLKDNLSFDDIKKIEQFFNSPLGIKLLRAKEVYREREFLIRFFADEIYSELRGQNIKDKVIVQGIIDLFFVDNNDIVYLIDYKYVNASSEQIESTYAYQIELYKLALCKILNRDMQSINAFIWDVNKGIYIKM